MNYDPERAKVALTDYEQEAEREELVASALHDHADGHDRSATRLRQQAAAIRERLISDGHLPGPAQV